MIGAWCVLLEACGCRDEQLEPFRQAVDAFDDGVELLEAQDPEGAREAFDRALEHRPEDVLLLAWKARAVAETGDFKAAIGMLEHVNSERPDLVEARYNKAAYLARSGEVERAAAELRLVLDGGAANADQVREDADFQPWLEHPAFAFLPAANLVVSAEIPEKSVFWGSDASVTLSVTGARGGVVFAQARAASGPLEQLGGHEDYVENPAGPVVELSWVFRVRGAGKVQLGPIDLWAGSRRGELDELSFDTTAPSGREIPADLPSWRVQTPAQMVEGHIPPAAFRDRKDLVVLIRPRDHVTLEPPSPSMPMRFEHRENGVVTWMVLVYSSPGPLQVVVKRANQVVLEASL